ncbi:MAG TPA: rRNA maturation RNase YbeY [Bacteroidales bacterium]|nr:rRNA maturation RNase YbeY [Bacteroidales bacterium]
MSALIQFFTEEVFYDLQNEQAIREWIIRVIREEGFEPGFVNFILCNDAYLLELNQRFLERNTLTDVIAFDYSEEEGEVAGDVFISIERTGENADIFGVTPVQELHRVIIHGTLHLCGHDDDTPEAKSLMTEREDKYLSLLPF